MNRDRRPARRPSPQDTEMRSNDRQRTKHDRSFNAERTQNASPRVNDGYNGIGYGRSTGRGGPPDGDRQAGRYDRNTYGRQAGIPPRGRQDIPNTGARRPKPSDPQPGRRSEQHFGVGGQRVPDPQMRRQSAYRDPRADAYVRQRREAEIRAERARRAEYERRRAVAREARRRLEEQLKREKKIRRQRQRKLFFGRAVVCFVIFAILSLILGIGLALHFSASPDSPPSRISYTFGGKEKRIADADDAFRNGNVYVCFNDVAEYLGLSVTGDTSGMRFVFTDDSSLSSGSAGSGNEDSVTFLTDSRTVIINTRKITLPSESFLYGESIWVSASFIEEFVEGLTVTRKGSTVAVSRVEDPALSTKDEPVYLAVSLKLKASAPIPEIDFGDENASELNPTVEFTNDLSAYEEFMDPAEADEYLVLVNTASPVDGTFIPTDLIDVASTRQDGRDMQYLRSCAAKALEALFIEMNAAGHTDVSVTSAYRSYDSQVYLHNYYIDEEMAADPSLTWDAAKALVLTYSAEPGTSEHQTGLCVDMHNLDSATTEFASTEAYRWLYDNAWKFGFILRFPEGKTDLTGISFEPWHWRFVGRSAAWDITSGGLCLEEYLTSQTE